MVKVRDRGHIPVTHQHLAQVINAVVCVDCDGCFAAGVDGCLVVHAVADVVQAVQLVEDFDLHDGRLRRAVRGVGREGLWRVAEEGLVLGGGQGVDPHCAEKVMVLAFVCAGFREAVLRACVRACSLTS